MATVTLSKENFESQVSNHDMVVIDFWAPWCGPCQSFGPVFEAVSEAHDDILFAKINTQDEPELAGYFNVRSIPTLVVIRDNIVIFSQPGALPKAALEDVIRQCKALDMDSVRNDIAKAQAN